MDVKYYFNYSLKILNNYSFMSLLKPKSLDSILHFYTIKPIVIGGYERSYNLITNLQQYKRPYEKQKTKLRYAKWHND